MLILAVHTVSEISARIPFCMMVLSDHLSRNAIPEGLKARLLIPTSGTTSMSLWDTPDVQTLLSWLEETLSEYCTTECFEAIEEFSQGLAIELARVRVSESVAAKTGAAAATMSEKATSALSVTASKAQEATKKVGKQLGELDQKYHLKETAKTTGTKVKENTKVAINKVGKVATNARDRALSNEVVAAGVQRIGSGVKVGLSAGKTGLSFMGKAFSQLSETVMKSVQDMDNSASFDDEMVDDEINAALSEEAKKEEVLPEEKKVTYFDGFGDNADKEGIDEQEVAPSTTEANKADVEADAIDSTKVVVEDKQEKVEEIKDDSPKVEETISEEALDDRQSPKKTLESSAEAST